MAAAKPKAPAFPKTFGACADLLYDVRRARLDAQKVVDELQARETALKEHLINNIPKSEGGAIGRVAKVLITVKSSFKVEDWDKLYAYVKKTGSFELLQRRLSDAAIAERADAGKPVPGVGRFNYPSISLTKV